MKELKECKFPEWLLPLGRYKEKNEPGCYSVKPDGTRERMKNTKNDIRIYHKSGRVGISVRAKDYVYTMKGSRKG